MKILKFLLNTSHVNLFSKTQNKYEQMFDFYLFMC